jgi:CheY-like chemotaxis protein
MLTRLLLIHKISLIMGQEFPSVLLADDDPDDRNFFYAAMQRVYPDVIVRTFDDGDHLLEYLRYCPEDGVPGCIVLDYNMPLLAAPQFLEATGPGTQYAQIPKIVWSTSQLKSEVDECLHLGALRFVIKPITDHQLDYLIRRIGRWLVYSAGTE